MYNLIVYSERSAWQYHKGDPNDNIIDSESFKFTSEITRRTPAAGNTKDVEIVMPLTYLSNF